ncbi:hypothetical protein HPP92_011807 [Vanilla planifolia]|uniref:SUMO-activating enzyme subunit n=1 Tax=Vanilla planifolia TaxID=51239 RepID=A0A835QYB5_VANPL|nr:hypothetical protein HPP92_011807 [Vanilla planifolia]
MAPGSQLEAVKAAKVLMVGAGGIGCELLKTLALSGFEDIHIIDMDTIEVSNLNRQFLFRQSHVGQSKAKQFSVVLNGLDNLDARRHVNRLCLAAEVPLIESGTTGFLGQVTVHVKGKTECYECQPKPTQWTLPQFWQHVKMDQEKGEDISVRKFEVANAGAWRRELALKAIPVLLLHFVHSVVWAKDLLFAKLFGDRNQDNDLNVRSSDVDGSKTTENVFELSPDEDPISYGQRIYDHVFGYNIELALANEETWRNRRKPKAIHIKDVLSEISFQQNGALENCTNEGTSISAMSTLDLKNPQDVWSLEDNSKVFLEALRLFITKREKEIGSLTFDKDDQLAVEFVTAAANIRASSFGIPMHSFFETKGIAGNIVHAVATTNAIIAGLIVIEAIKVLQNDFRSYRMTYCLEHPSKKLLLMPVEPFEANKSCYVCSETPLLLEINTQTSKLCDFVEKIVRNKLGMNLPLIMNGSNLIFEAGDDLEEDVAANYMQNLNKVLAELPSPVTSGTVLTVEDLQQELTCNINIKHREEFDEEKEPDGMVLSGWLERAKDDQLLSNGQSTLLGTKRKISEAQESSENLARPFSETNAANQEIPQQIDDNNDDDEDMVMLDGPPEASKKKRFK